MLPAGILQQNLRWGWQLKALKMGLPLADVTVPSGKCKRVVASVLLAVLYFNTVLVVVLWAG